MPKQNEFRGITNDVVSSFISRNNDVGGYWGIGQLYKFARRSNLTSLTIDLVSRQMTPHDPIFDEMINFYSNQLEAQVQLRRLPKTWLQSAHMFVSFYPASKLSRYSLKYVSDPYICVLEIVSWSGRLYTKSQRGECWPHKRHLESKSTRA